LLIRKKIIKREESIMYVTMIVSSFLAWLAGFYLDGNIAEDLYFRILFPVIAVGLCLLTAIKDNNRD